MSDSYATAKTVYDYIDETSFSMFNGVATISGTSGNDATKLVFVYDKNTLINNDFYQGKVLQIPVNFGVYSGSTFEDNSLEYANYKVQLTVSMLTSLDQDPYQIKQDYIKYTNARIFLDKVDRSKS